jgi:glutathione S-transferase
MIKLYGIPMSRAARCLWMLEELGVDYELVPTSFLGDAQKPEYLKLNPNGRIPALDDDGVVLFESLAINLHLARKYDAGLWPKTEAGQSHAVQWSVWAMTEVEPPVMEVLMNRVFLPEAQRDAAAAKAGEAALEKPVKVLEQVLAGKQYLLEDRFTVADLNVHSVLNLAPLMGGCDLSAYPNVSAWLKRCAARPALQRLPQA